MWAIFCVLTFLSPVFASKPSLMEMRKDFGLIEGMDLFLLQCYLLSGSKPVFFDWHKNGQRLFNSSKVKIDNFDSLSTLSLTELHRSDSAVYSCGVKNAFGNDSTSTIINIKGFLLISNFIQFSDKMWRSCARFSKVFIEII